MQKLLMLLTISAMVNAGWRSKLFTNKTGQTVTLLVVVKEPDRSRTQQIRDQNSAYVMAKLIDKKKNKYETLQSVHVTAPGNKSVTLDIENGNKIVDPNGLTLEEVVDGYDITKI